MRTYRKGWIKKHKECNSLAQYIESLDPTHSEWDIFCLKCQKYITEDEISLESRKPLKQACPEIINRELSIHFGNNGIAECGKVQATMFREIKLTTNPKEVTCYRCKKTHQWMHEISITKSHDTPYSSTGHGRDG